MFALTAGCACCCLRSACNPVIIEGRKLATTWSAAAGYCVVAEAVGHVPAAVPSLAPGDQPLLIDVDGMVKLEPTPGLDGWALLAPLDPSAWRTGGSYLSKLQAAGRAVGGFDFIGAFGVVNVTIRAASPDAPFQLEVLAGPKKGRDVCFNQHGVDFEGGKPWSELPFPRKVTYSMADTVAAMWESSDSESQGWVGKKVHDSLRQDVLWSECTFTVTRYSPVTLKVTGGAVEVETGNVREQMRLVYQATAMALLINAEMISESLLVWCTSGAAAGSVVLSVLIVVYMFRKVDNNRRGVPILAVLGGGVWQLISSFWYQYWQYILALYAITGIFGCYYCYRHPLGETSTAMFSFMLQAVALALSYWAVADSGAGLIFMLSQLIGYELLTTRRSILYTARGLLARLLAGVGIVSEQRLVRLGLMTQHKIFAHNSLLNDETLLTPVRRPASSHPPIVTARFVSIC